jgi:8-oxo-dGTP pyrophosphatase MutT (NUDIX family)
MMFKNFIETYHINYQKGLPGKSGQLPMKPYVGLDKHIDIKPTNNAKKGAVLALIYPIEDIPHLALMQRPNYDGVHSGQISFPGGKIEDFDKSPLHAALREANEEIGIIQEQVEIIGPITEVFVLASNFLVYPFVGYMSQRPDFLPDKREVEAIIEVPLHHFMNPNIIGEKEMQTKAGFFLKAPYYDVNGMPLWGATAMMISEIVAISRAEITL